MKKKEKLKEYRNELVDVFTKINGDKMLTHEFLLDIMTPAEFDEASIRWQIVKKLKKGNTHRQVAGDLGIGISTVNRGSRELRNKNGGFVLMLKKLGL